MLRFVALAIRTASLLNRIHERALLAVEDEDAEEEDGEGEEGGVEEAGPVHLAHAGDHVAGVGEDALEGVHLQDQREAAVTGDVNRIDDGGGVHPQLQAEGDEVVQIAVFHREG